MYPHGWLWQGRGWFKTRFWRHDERYLQNPSWSFCQLFVRADGASVNMGIYTGACTQIKNDGRDWFLKIHCANHRLELPIGSAYADEPKFKIPDNLQLNIYQLFKNSGKLRRLLPTIALNLSVTCVFFIRSHGTRFQNHKYGAIKALLINLVPLYLLCENMITGGSDSCHSATTLSTLKDFFDKLQSCKYLAAIHFCNCSLILHNAKTTMFDCRYCRGYQRREIKDRGTPIIRM